MGLVVALLTWSVVTRNFRVTVALALVLACAGVYVVAVAEEFQPFFRRTLTLATDLDERALPRTQLFPLYGASIRENPLVGVGIGGVRGAESGDTLSAFLAAKLRTGGHGSYISLLYLFGLAAFVPFLLLLVACLRSSFQMFRRAASAGVSSLALFCFLFLVYYMFPMVVEGNGGDPLLFGVMGIVTGLWGLSGWDRVPAPAREPAPVSDPPVGGRGQPAPVVQPSGSSSAVTGEAQGYRVRNG